MPDGTIPAPPRGTAFPTRRKCCGKCAFRHGSQERSDAWAWLRLAEHWTEHGGAFHCHEGVPGHPGRVEGVPDWTLCAGREATRGLDMERLMRLAAPAPAEDADDVLLDLAAVQGGKSE